MESKILPRSVDVVLANLKVRAESRPTIQFPIHELATRLESSAIAMPSDVRPAIGKFYVIEGSDGEQLPCSRTEIRLHDEASAEALLDILHRLGHAMENFAVERHAQTASRERAR